jgi:hypothetical protein
VREGFGENLDRDVAFEMLIACGVDLAHSAFAEFGEDLIRTQFPPDHALVSPATARLRVALSPATLRRGLLAEAAEQ